MPTERFYRLPKEKAEVIRAAAAKEFMRVPPEEASINKIIRDAEISRGSFYTYFADKDDLLKWLVSGNIKRHLRFYVNQMQENGGDIWDVFDRVLDSSIERIKTDSIIDIMENLMKSNRFSELFLKGSGEDNKTDASNKRYMEWLYQHLDKEKCPMDRETFQDLVEMHTVILMMAIKQLFLGGKSRETITNYYKKHMGILRYGIYGYRTGNDATGKNQEEKIYE